MTQPGRIYKVPANMPKAKAFIESANQLSNEGSPQEQYQRFSALLGAQADAVAEIIEHLAGLTETFTTIDTRLKALEQR